MIRSIACALAAATVLSVSTRARAADPSPAPAPTPSTASLPAAAAAPKGDTPYNLLSGELYPFIILDTIQLEYERVITPTLGGVAVRARTDLFYIGIFYLVDFGTGLHYTFYIPLSANDHGPGGLIAQAGGDIKYWHGRFYGPAGYSATVNGVAVEPNVYVGYRLMAQQFFVTPRVGLGYSIGGGRYTDDAGNRVFADRTHGFHTHFDIMLGIAF